jgi:carbon monoxide dehydrogenase subunit G
MAKIKLQKIVRAPIEKTVGFFGNPEIYYGVHSGDDVSYKVVSSGENEILVEEERAAGRQRLKSTSRMTLHLPRRIDSEVIAGAGEGSKSTTTFESVSEGTKVTFTMDMKLGGMAGRVLGRMLKKWMKKALEEELEKDRKYLEGS